MAESLRERLDIATRIAWEAGKATLRHFQSSTLETAFKADRTPVTVADHEAEAVLRESLRRAFPEDGVLGEEAGEDAGSSGMRWIVDPIDGTKSFVQGVPLYGVLVALVDATNRPLLGVVHLPGLGEMVGAARGEGCYWNGRRASVSRVSTMAEACVVYTGAETFDMTGTGAAFDRVRGRARIVRGWGDCYGHVLVATGRADAMLDPILADWDCAALQPIVEEAGGTFTDWRGEATVFGKSGVSTNGLVKDELFGLLSEPR